MPVPAFRKTPRPAAARLSRDRVRGFSVELQVAGCSIVSPLSRASPKAGFVSKSWPGGAKVSSSCWRRKRSSSGPLGGPDHGPRTRRGGRRRRASNRTEPGCPRTERGLRGLQTPWTSLDKTVPTDRLDAVPTTRRDQSAPLRELPLDFANLTLATDGCRTIPAPGSAADSGSLPNVLRPTRMSRLAPTACPVAKSPR